MTETARHGGHMVARLLRREGVGTVFTLPGGHIAPIYDGCVAEGIEVVGFRHQQSAVHAADGWARITRTPGVAVVTAGPGVTNAVGGMANAMYADSPLILLAGKSPLAELGMGSFQEMDQVAVMEPVTKWAATCWETRRIGDLLAEAFRRAASGRFGPVFLDVPIDVLLGEAVPGVETPGLDPPAPPGGDPGAVSRAARMIEEAEHPVVFAGSGVHWSGGHEALAALADDLKAPVFLSSLGRGCLPPDHPAFFSAARKLALGKCDVLLALGVDWDYRLGFGRRNLAEEVRVIQVDVDPARIGRNRPVEAGIVGDPRLVIGQLIAQGVGRPAEPAWTGEVRDEERRLWEEARAGMESDAVPIHPLRMAREIRDFIEPDCTVVGDGGDIVGIAGSVIHAHRPGHWLDPGPLGCLGVGAGFAMAAKVARPDGQALVVYGDGSFGLAGVEYESAIRQGIPFVGVIGNDGAWGQVRVAQEALSGEGSAPASTLSPEAGYERMVEGLGGYGERVTEPGEIRPALQRAFDSGVAACLNVILDPALMRRASYLA